MPPRHRGRFARLLTGLARHPDAQVAGEACDHLAKWSNAAPEVAAELASIVADLDCPQWPRAVFPLIGGGLAASNEFFLLPSLINDLVTATGKDIDAERDRDAPARQRLAEIAEQLRDPAHDWSYPEGVLRTAARDLRTDQEFAWLAVRLLAMDTRFDDESCTGSLLDIAEVAAGRPLLVARAVAEIGAVLENSRIDNGRVLLAVHQLTSRGDLAGGLIAVELLKSVGERIGWPQPTRSSLRWLRRHPDGDVRAAAWSVFSAVE